MVRLVTFDAKENHLSGGVPEAAGLMRLLKILELQHNGFCSAFPAGLTRLFRFGLSANKLSGTLPSGIASLTRVHCLLLEVNALSGLLPEGLPHCRRCSSCMYPLMVCLAA